MIQAMWYAYQFSFQVQRMQTGYEVQDRRTCRHMIWVFVCVSVAAGIGYIGISYQVSMPIPFRVPLKVMKWGSEMLVKNALVDPINSYPYITPL